MTSQNCLFHQLSIITLIISLSSCANLNSQVHNDPSYSFTGNRVKIAVFKGKDFENVTNSPDGATLYKFAHDYLTKKGFEVVPKRKNADILVAFTGLEDSKDIYVPGYTYNVPIYGNLNNGTTTTIKNSYGQTLGTLETVSSNPNTPTGYQSKYVEGYNARVMDRWLLLSVDTQEKDKSMRTISSGQIYPESRKQHFFNSPQVMQNAVERLLNESVFGNKDLKLAKSTDAEPGCALRLGITFKNQNSIEIGSEIESFSPESTAEKEGLKARDIVHTIDGYNQPNTNTPKFTVGRSVPVTGTRNGKKFSYKITPANICPED